MTGKGLLDDFRLTAHVSVGCRLAIHRLAQLQVALNGFRTQVEQLLDLPGNLAVAYIYLASVVGVDVDIHWMGHADGIADLYEHLVGNAGSHHVLGNVAGCVGCTTVYFGRILA